MSFIDETLVDDDGLTLAEREHLERRQELLRWMGGHRERI
jgi:hypothetical protein